MGLRSVHRVLSLGAQWPYIVMAGAGIGLLLGPASTDAVNRAIDASYGEVTGITQTVRNYASTLGIAVLGTVLTTVLTSRLTGSLVAPGVPARPGAPTSPTTPPAAAPEHRRRCRPRLPSSCTPPSHTTSPPRPRACSTAWRIALALCFVAAVTTRAVPADHTHTTKGNDHDQPPPR